jgi:hypothetical protein
MKAQEVVTVLEKEFDDIKKIIPQNILDALNVNSDVKKDIT